MSRPTIEEWADQKGYILDGEDMDELVAKYEEEYANELDAEADAHRVFFKSAEFVLAPGKKVYDDSYEAYQWEDFKAAKKFYEEHPDYHVYTLTAEGSTGIISKGWLLFNRVGYFFSKTEAIITDDGIRYW